MSAETTTGRPGVLRPGVLRPGVLRRWIVPAVLVSLGAGLCSLAPAPEAALAASRGIASISAGGEHACAIMNGAAYCWGENYNGELGDGTNSNSAVPVAVDTTGVLAGKTLVQITAGYENTCALDSTGSAYCWGADRYGQLGDGTTSNSNVPMAVSTTGVLAGKTLTQITTGLVDTCALDSAGAGYCWGWNAYGQLGDGTTTDSSVPVAVSTGGALGGARLSQITVGAYATCAVVVAGAPYCWGYNTYGELGDGTNTSSDVPVAVDTSGALAGKFVTLINASWYHTCAVDTTGAAYCWGQNDHGQLGDASSADSSVPVAVDASGALAGKALTQITAGAFDTCALDVSGAAYCWGYDSYGELGNGSTTSSSVPVAVDTGGLLEGKVITQIYAGVWHTCALDAAGAAYCWGANASGELGDDATPPSAVPVLVGL
jgi:alpha-tubulin suppressor-like RCC1 family protein